jgi:hypothetical protein
MLISKGVAVPAEATPQPQVEEAPYICLLCMDAPIIRHGALLAHVRVPGVACVYPAAAPNTRDAESNAPRASDVLSSGWWARQKWAD